jgi:peptidoglycan/xylan/chitin deacetylase (PgdA/CDA1 family)
MHAILTYHSIDASDSAISVTPEAFRRHVEWLAAGRVRVVPLAELAGLPEETDAVALTFDDAFANFGEVAAPLLKEHGLPATLFVVSDHVGGTNAWGGQDDPRVPTLPLLGWEALGRLQEDGITLGGHTRRHPHLTRLGAQELEDELCGSTERIQAETGRRPEEFAYPYGDLNDEVAAATGRVYARAVTTELRVMGRGEDPLRLPRLDMYYLRGPGQLEAFGTARFAGNIWMRAQARRVRAALGTLGGEW